jgi:RNA polymerase sigma-70 factor (ECF subfamily)
MLFTEARMERTIENHRFSMKVEQRPVMAVVAPPDEICDQDLMLQAQKGNTQAFAEIYNRYISSILSYLYRFLGNAEDVEAVGQEVFLRAFRFRATYQYPQRLSTWLFTIARNLAINQSRRRRRDPVRNVTELHLDGIEISGEASLAAAGAAMDADKKEQIQRAMTALEQLPPDQREAIVLGIFQDLSYAEMEEITGTKAVTLRSRMFHGLRKLAAIMEQNGRKVDVRL